MDLYIDEKDKELGRARLSQGGEGASAGGGRRGGGRRRARDGAFHLGVQVGLAEHTYSSRGLL